MKYDVETLRPIIGEPGQHNAVDGFVWWHGGGRITACAREDICAQTSVLFRNLRDDADLRAVIAGMGERIRDILAAKEAARRATEEPAY